MGSQSDWPTLMHGGALLERASRFRMKDGSSRPTERPIVLSTMRNPRADRGLQVIIAGAGGAAHLPGMVAAMTPLPVLGVPIESKALSGLDSLLSIVQMPGGVPVGTLAIGKAGAINAALLAASIVALSDEGVRERLAEWRRTQTAAVAEVPVDPMRTARGTMTLPPNSTIGIVGGGQLGRMIGMAAALSRLSRPCLHRSGRQLGGTDRQPGDRGRV